VLLDINAIQLSPVTPSWETMPLATTTSNNVDMVVNAFAKILALLDALTMLV